MMKHVLSLTLAVALAGCASDLERMSRPVEAALGFEPTGKPLGSAQNPVRVWMPAGQRAYLARLRCSNGQTPTFSRIGSAGDSPTGSVMDAYEVLCPGAEPARSVIYLDMYHDKHVETAAPPGFTIAS